MKALRVKFLEPVTLRDENLKTERFFKPGQLATLEASEAVRLGREGRIRLVDELSEKEVNELLRLGPHHGPSMRI
jgi:hypothetical protein